MIKEHEDSEFVNYVIVVHGIGEQRQNETLIPVINRFAQARQEDMSALYEDDSHSPVWQDRISLGKLASQIGRRNYNEIDDFSSQSSHWIEMKGIPSKKPTSKAEHYFFDGEEDDVKNGKNVRFVDVWWADILREQNKISGEDIKPWTDAVIARLTELQFEHDRHLHGNHQQNTVSTEPWITLILEEIQETSLFAQKVAGLPYVNFGKQFNQILEQYVGDIQAYGENSKVRGKAVARFHKVMENLTRQHFENPLTKNKTPKFTVLAHSLGTVMTLDAIMYGHIYKKDAFPERVLSKASEIRFAIPNIPFKGYDDRHLNLPNEIELDNAEVVGETWINYVETLITLGSPVDKYLKLWPQNYRYLLDLKPEPKSGLTEDLKIFGGRKSPKITHLNYCDVQDPVGHHLNELKSRTTYQNIFSEDSKDIVFSRYYVPGGAHVKYWQDTALFRDILNLSIDKDLKPTEKQVEETLPFRSDAKPSPKKYWPIIILTYYVPTILATIVSTLIFAWGWYELHGSIVFPDAKVPRISWGTVVFCAAAFALSAYFFKKVISLFIWWRQLMKKLSNQPTSGGIAFFHFLLWGGLATLFIVTPFCIARTIMTSPIPQDDWLPRWAFGGIIVLIYFLIWVISRYLWQIASPKRHGLNKSPEIITILLMGALAGITFCFMEMDEKWFTVPFKIRGVEWFPMFTMALTALTICWIYVAFSLVSIKAQIRIKNAKAKKHDHHHGPIDHGPTRVDLTAETDFQASV